MPLPRTSRRPAMAASLSVALSALCLERRRSKWRYDILVYIFVHENHIQRMPLSSTCSILNSGGTLVLSASDFCYLMPMRCSQVRERQSQIDKNTLKSDINLVWQKTP
uniref:uncharacterized protein LOC105350481 n=1 Tax=Fragaria vesca subsp. vesca TaxID=101020 RepID=UPI0005CB229E|nr:PREDICTED: uncharacterized protein LOC105350481 [Fragaria vesca subsp. vesca]